ncbi:MAG: FAD binding domain-containing protein [Candidatus Omnitrophica bacterium]|nr:FAD binding domain-containing protein [Candidatus Omnitrophota bacterium]
MLLNPFTYYSPKSLAQAVELLNKPNCKILSGGTILIANLKMFKKRDIKSPEHVISLRHIPELKGITSTKTSIEIGAMTTLDELQKSQDVANNFPLIKDACTHIGTTPIRNMATMGGNLTCRFSWTELGSVMIALNAVLKFSSSKGEKIISAENYFANQAKDEGILTKIIITKKENLLSAYRRIGKKTLIDKPSISLSVAVENCNDKLTNCRVVFNTGNGFAQRDTKAENFLNEKKVKDILIQQAAQNTSADIISKNLTDYKQHMCGELLKQALDEIMTCK